MALCKNCSIEDKLLYCCGMHPETHERRKIRIFGKCYEACPGLDSKAKCSKYSSKTEKDVRPLACKKEECIKTSF